MALHYALLELFQLVFKQICEVRRHLVQLLLQFADLSLLFILKNIEVSLQLGDLLLQFRFLVLLSPDSFLVLFNRFF